MLCLTSLIKVIIIIIIIIIITITIIIVIIDYFINHSYNLLQKGSRHQRIYLAKNVYLDIV